jgi:uncharacterized membrane protein
MDEYMVVLRLIHILVGIFWVGAAWFMVGVALPTLRAVGPDGQPFMRGLLTRSRFVIAMPTAALLTTVSGLLLYYRVSDHFNSDWMGSTPGVTLSIGVVAGLLAFGHGVGVTAMTARRLARLIREIEGQGGPPSEEQSARLRALQAKMGASAPITAGLMVIAVIGMASWRYM